MTMARLARILLAILLMLPARLAFAVQPDEIMKNPALEARARALSQQLRCMVCQNQSIDDSDAPLARDLRLLVRERIAKGDSNAQVIDFLVARYGPFVLLKPPLNPHTLLLWVLTPFALAAGAIALVLYARRRQRLDDQRHRNGSAPLSAEEETRLAELMRQGRPQDSKG
jgi:cytochrome c-type biogenesis protein CcmH